MAGGSVLSAEPLPCRSDEKRVVSIKRLDQDSLQQCRKIPERHLLTLVLDWCRSIEALGTMQPIEQNQSFITRQPNIDVFLAHATIISADHATTSSYAGMGVRSCPVTIRNWAKAHKIAEQPAAQGKGWEMNDLLSEVANYGSLQSVAGVHALPPPVERDSRYDEYVFGFERGSLTVTAEPSDDTIRLGGTGATLPYVTVSTLVEK